MTTERPQPDREQSARPQPERPLAEPRPLAKPAVDQATAQAFARPADGGRGAPVAVRSFAESDLRLSRRVPPPEAATAFARPEGETESLQRDPRDDPGGVPPESADERAAETGTWRDPRTPVHRGEGVPAADDEDGGPEPAPAEKLGVRDVLFGGRVSYRALAVLAVTALAIGGLGGVVGALTTDTGRFLTSSRVSLPVVSDAELRGIDDETARVIAAVMPATVNVKVTTPTSGAEGSGAVIDRGGYVLTNNHVISSAANTTDAEIRVRFFDDRSVPARIVGRDTGTDLAVLKVDNVDDLTVMEMGDADALRVGEPVVAIGSPLGLDKTVTTGIVSAVHRPVSLRGEGTDTAAVIDAVQTDAAINQGNSGGPLVNRRGQLVGINTLIMSQSGGSVGLGFAIPSNDAARIAEALIRDGSVRHATIGVDARTASNGRLGGAEIANVRADSPASRAGFEEGDVVIRVGDRKVQSAEELEVAIRRSGADREVSVVLLRQGREETRNVTPVAA